jgi:glyoxylase-like metal-dependent hydrolase (beta-lactamase superfamily II)
MPTPANRYGSATIHRVIDLDPFPLPLGFLFPGATVAALAPFGEILAGSHVDIANASVLLAIQSHLVRFAGKTILVDACVGEHKQRPMRPDWHQRAGTSYLANLAAAGCSPDDIDVVMCTHLHADHVGWNTRLESGRWVPTFAKARYLVSQAEIDVRAAQAAADPSANHGSYQDSVLPILERGLFDMADAGDEIADGAKLVALPGHAPGQIGLEIIDERILFCGDAIHSPAQIIRPEWSSFLCHDPAQAADTRRALIERAVAEDLRLMPAHLRAASMQVRENRGAFIPHFET